MSGTGAVVNIDHSQHPVFAAGVVVNLRAADEMDIAAAEPARCLKSDLLLANADRFFEGKAMIVTAVISAGFIVRAVLFVLVSAVLAIVTAASGVWSGSIGGVAKRATRVVVPAGVVILSAGIPGQVEGIAFRASSVVFDLNNGDSAVSRIANQGLPTPAIDTFEGEVDGVGGKR